MVRKGKISSVSGDGKTAVVILGNAQNSVTPPLTVPFFLIDCLAVDMSVAYADFEDGTGIILARLDGEWNHTLYEQVKIEGTAEVTGFIKAADLVTESVASYNSHTHSETGSVTGAPR